MTTAEDVVHLDVRGLSRLLASRELSAVELTERYLSRIEEHNAVLNAFITVDAGQALEQARAADRRLIDGHTVHPLTGIPVALKDTIPTAGLRTTGGSRVLGDWVPDEDPRLVSRLRSLGAVIIGKANLHEFAYGGTSENEHFGPVRNPWDPRRVAGGSSGGSAAAVAAGLCAVAVGTDAAGSVRVPACQCGIVGFKPSYGHVHTRGLIPLGWSLDHVGAIARTVADAELLQNAISETLTTAATLGAAQPPAVEDLKIGVPTTYAFAGVQDDIVQRVEEALDVLRGLGVTVTEIEVPGLDRAPDVAYVILAGEASAYHSQWWPDRADDYGADLRRKLEAAMRLSARDYVQAQRARAQIVASLAAVLEDVDAIVTPTVPLAPQPVGQREVSFAGQTRPSTGGGVFIRLTAPFNLSGGPAISVPCGLTDEGLPTGLQIASAPGEDELVLRLAAAYEHAHGTRYVPPTTSPTRSAP
jgi:aspartyl-tRNA(Asn)/glutamyl-tRNA(Gln) amidotransferase subunit A